MLCGQNDPALLGRRNARGGAPECGVSAQADFDENQYLSVVTDEIDLAATAAVIACHDPEFLLFEEARRQVFGLLAASVARSARVLVVAH